jgi:hypothetical protein
MDMKAEGDGQAVVAGDRGDIALGEGRFFGGESFDPADAAAYLRSFAIRSVPAQPLPRPEPHLPLC